MNHATASRATTLLFATVATLALVAGPTLAAGIMKAEHVTGGTLDLPWLNGFGVSNNMTAVTLDPGHPAYANPSGDHTVGCATNSIAPDSGGVVLTATDPMGVSDYSWEAWLFTGDGSTRRGLVVRADPGNQFQSSYQFVLDNNLSQIKFRKLVNGAPTTLRTWIAAQVPGGTVPNDTWVHLKVTAQGPIFHCYYNDLDLTTVPDVVSMAVGPIDDSDLPAGWPGVYSFRFDVGGIPVYTDDLIMTELESTPVNRASWGEIKNRYSK